MPVAVVVFALVGMQVTMLPFRVLGWPRADTVSAGMEVTMRNMNLALLLKAGLFPDRGPAALGPEVMFVVLFYAARPSSWACRSRSTSGAWPAATAPRVKDRVISDERAAIADNLLYGCRHPAIVGLTPRGRWDRGRRSRPDDVVK